MKCGQTATDIDRETFEAIQKQFILNKQESIRSNTHREELGLLRAGYIFCGICHRRMQVTYRPPSKTGNRYVGPAYTCRQKTVPDLGIVLNHRTNIGMQLIDSIAWEKVIAVLQNYPFVRARVEELREANKPVVDSASIESSLERIRRSMQNLYRLAEQATDDETIAHLTQRMNELEKQKRDAEALLYDIADDEEERTEIETEITKFEEWAQTVRPLLTDPTYEPSYEEKRLAVRILGLHVTVFPTRGDFPYRYHVGVTIPAIMKKLSSGTNEGWIVDPTTLGLSQAH